MTGKKDKDDVRRNIGVRMSKDELHLLDQAVKAINDNRLPDEKQWTRADVLRNGFIDNMEHYSSGPPVEIPVPGLEAPRTYIVRLIPVVNGDADST